MTFAQAYALTRRNAIACEEAKNPRCVCYCGGKGHGTAHSSKAIFLAAQELYEREGGTEIPMQLDGP